MDAWDWATLVPVAGIALMLLLTDRWGHFIGTRNWRVSRRIDQRTREHFRKVEKYRAEKAPSEGKS